jgi:hypothetical protein
MRDAADRKGRNRDAGLALAFLNIGNPDGYQNKGVASWQKRMVVKTKGLRKLAQIGKNAERRMIGGVGGEWRLARSRSMLAHLLHLSSDYW